MKLNGGVNVRTADGTLTPMNDSASKALSTRLTLITHAPTDALKRGGFPGDESFSEDEFAKIVALDWNPPRAQYVCCASEKRTQQTANALGLRPSVLPALSDVNYGSWNGKEIDEIYANDPEGLAAWLRDPAAAPHGGESYLHLLARVRQWMTADLEAGHTVAVTHPAVVRAAIICALQTSPDAFFRIEIGPLTLSDLRLSGKLWTVRSAGCSLRRS